MASSIVKSAAQQLGNLLVEEAKYLYKVRDKIEGLQVELAWMECFLRDADTLQHREKVICMWVSQVRDLAYDVEDVIERYLHEVTHHRRYGIRDTLKWFSCILFSRDCWTLHNLGSEIDDMTIKMADLTSRLQRYGIQIIQPTKSVEYNNMVRQRRMTYSHTKEDVVGRDGDTQELVDVLLKEDVNVLCIKGIAGLGKTTLARRVFSDKRIQDKFKSCAWVFVSQKFDRNRIFQEILIELEKGEDAKKMVQELSVEQLPKMIDEVLKRNRCLIVLDDVWRGSAWEQIKAAFESIKGSQSKILLTTRNQSLLEHVDRHGYLHPLKPLSVEDSWKLLRRKAFAESAGQSTDGDQGKSDLERVGREMLRHCGGLPLALTALGGILSTKWTLFQWEGVRDNIASYMSSVEGQENGGVSEVIELSYHDLPFYLKPCFLYLGNYPEDCKIATIKLYRLWQAEGLLVEGESRKKGSVATTYDVGERYLDELIQRSMVQVVDFSSGGRVKSFQVHDVMRDMCLRKGDEVNFLDIMELTDFPKRSVSSALARCSTEDKKMRRCAIHWKEVDNDHDGDQTSSRDGKHGKKKPTCIRSLLVFRETDDELVTKNTPDYEIISKKTWKCFPFLRVLDLEGACINNLPKGVEELIHLRYLSLRDTMVQELPQCVLDLKRLEDLDLDVCYSVKLKLPCNIQALERLKHLYLPFNLELEEGKKLIIPVNRIETLKNFNPNDMKTEDLLKMKNLRNFSLSASFNFSEAVLLQEIMKAPVIEKSGQLINTMKLDLYASLLKKEPTILRSLGGHAGSFKLFIRGESGKCETVGNDIEDVLLPDSLTHVEVLSCKLGEGGLLKALENLPRLKKLELLYPTMPTRGKMSTSIGSFPQMNHLRIWCAQGFREWEIEQGALPNLQRLEINSCRQLRRISGLSDSISIEGNWQP